MTFTTTATPSLCVALLANKSMDGTAGMNRINRTVSQCDDDDGITLISTDTCT
jgi:hypothetical protein